MGQRNEIQPNRKRPKRFTTKMQSSLLLIFCGVVLLAILLILRIVQINSEDGSRYSKKVLNQQTYVNSKIPYKRGDIVDRNGTILATSVKVYNLVLDVKLLRQYEEYIDTTLSAIHTFFDIPMDELQTAMEEKKDKSYVVLKKQIDSEIYDAFEEYKKDPDNKVKAVWFEEEYKRSYPNNSLASMVLGFTYSSNTADYGIEASYQNQLNGTDGLSYGYFDNDLNLVRKNKPAVNGNTVVTTLDAHVQQIVEEKIREFDKQFPTTKVSVLVMNPKNGDIYAMATDTQYDLNNPRDLTPFYTDKEIKEMSDEDTTKALFQIWRNTIISDSFEPGSTFKPITVAAALEENVIKYNDEFVCDGGEIVPGWTKRIKCMHTHGQIDLTTVIMKSCNDALMQIGAKLGKDMLYRYQKAFLFGSKTNIDLPGEDFGIVKSADNISAVDLATISFGQTDQVTMIQLASAFSALVNGGSYYEPHVMKQVQSESGSIVERNDGVLVNKVISEDTSNFIKQSLYETVNNPKGTATKAKVEGYAIGGKTGTAQTYPRSDDKFVLSFIGAAPMDDPEVVVYVTLYDVQDKTNNNYKNSGLACQLGGDIFEKILPFLGVYPSGDIDYSVWGVDPKKSKKDKKKKPETSTEQQEEPPKEIIPENPEDEEFNYIDDDIKPATDSSTEHNQNDTVGNHGSETEEETNAGGTMTEQSKDSGE